MRRLEQENRAFRAKQPGEIRPHYGMPRFAALAALAVIWATAGCFNVPYGDCRVTCSKTEACPRSLTCIMDPGRDYGRCAAPGTTECSSPNDDAGPVADAMDASDAPDASDVPDAIDEGDVDAPPPPPDLPPKVLCRDKSDCLELSDALRANLVLLLWPSNLPDVGSRVPFWYDQSGHGNHARALYPDYQPVVISKGVKLETTRRGTGFFIENSSSLDFGAGDFAVIVVAGLTFNNKIVGLFSKADGAPPPAQRQVTLLFTLSPGSVTSGRSEALVNDKSIEGVLDEPQPSVAVYGVQRVVDHVELRLNGVVQNSTDLDSGVSTTNSAGVYLGTGSLEGNVADSIAAVVAVRGSISATDLAGLESFLARNFAEPR